jgi:hypothetical protein
MKSPVSCRCSHLSKALITPLQARLASSIRSHSLSSPALRLTQVSHSALFVTPHLLTHLVLSSFQIYRAFSQNSVTKMPPIDKPVPGVKYDIVFIGGGSGGSAGSVCFTPVSTHVQELNTSCVASCLTLWRKDSPYRGIRKARRYLRKRWWVSPFWWFAYAHMRLAQAACRRR